MTVSTLLPSERLGGLDEPAGPWKEQPRRLSVQAIHGRFMAREWLVATSRHDGERVTGQQVARFVTTRVSIVVQVAMHDA